MFGFVYRAAQVPPVCRFVLHLIVYSSLYLSVAGAAMVYVSCLLQGLPFDPVAAVILMLVTFAVYNLNRKTDEDEDAINHSERYAFTKEYGPILFRSAAAAYIIALCLSACLGYESLLVTAVPLIAGVVYSVPLFPIRLGFRRLKEVPFMKSLIVAFSWAVPPALLPVCHAALPAGSAAGIVGVFFFLLVFTNTVVFDVRDVEGDMASGVKTIPTILGTRRALLLLTGINVSLGAALVLAGRLFLPGSCTALMLAAGIVYAQAYVLCFQRLRTKKLLFELLADGQFIVLGGVAYLLTLTVP
ncbi:UbiA family prenyltransferase [Methanoculleus sp. UBA303]|jgi:4-hydroxybenzoate polyprenyltransferase|uniref:UbiA family prenyltransferase n=1 Tax=Methanoculleus sp. UBA303 TaxID=1915497 RepID=UPI0025F4F1C9|nr:UbiA family prenyltransferase [Methanoculleus sp. UBA303]